MLQAIQQRADLLTPRERDVLTVRYRAAEQADCGGAGDDEKTVKVHRAQVMQKMQVSSVAQLVLLAEKVGLTAPSIAPRTKVQWLAPPIVKISICL